ncbi:MAG: hypothetical protein J5983_04780 [Ruminococcus sp.]|nr:hypothetical protein [Ruminococcus sp.]
MKIEYETSLDGAHMHIFLQEKYEEDYQIQMISHNKIEGILAMEGCETEECSRYTYEISGLVSMEKKYEKTSMKKEDLKVFITELLKLIEEVQKYMLDAGNLILRPECIFYKEGKWNFCYLPDNPDDMNQAFHKMTEYFVKTVDYNDTEAIFLAYELHKASFQENFSLKQVLSEYEKHGKERERELEELREKQKLHENIFSLDDDKVQDLKKIREEVFAYHPTPAVTAIREEVPGWQPWKRKRDPENGRWGRWNDLILESDH